MVYVIQGRRYVVYNMGHLVRSQLNRQTEPIAQQADTDSCHSVRIGDPDEWLHPL